MMNFELCKVIVKNGQHLLMTPKGELIEGIVFTRITDIEGEPTICLVKLFVDLEETI
jgi:hypothetical protein